MSPTQQEKQQTFKQKLQSEGADSFADGPRPWEQWDESGNQYDNRIWEGTARRIHPKRRGARGFGERLLVPLFARLADFGRRTRIENTQHPARRHHPMRD